MIYFRTDRTIAGGYILSTVLAGTVLRELTSGSQVDLNAEHVLPG